MKTKSEAVFESFLISNNIAFEKIQEAASPRPDYSVHIGTLKLIFEVKELAEDENLKDRAKGYKITIGDHVRRRIEGSRRQIQYGAKQGLPSILLIYNNIDPILRTENHDFITAMCGEYTFLLNKDSKQRSDWFNGKNRMLQESKNTSFSAVGRLSDRTGKTTVTLFENVFSKVQVPYDELPPCFELRRIDVSD